MAGVGDGIASSEAFVSSICGMIYHSHDSLPLHESKNGQNIPSAFVLPGGHGRKPISLR